MAERKAATRELGYNGMRHDTIVEAHLFDTSFTTGTPADAATFMMDVQYLRNEQVTTAQAAERMWVTRFSQAKASSILKWTEAQYDNTGAYTGCSVHTRSVRNGMARLRHYLLRNATHVPMESQQCAWKVLDRVETRTEEEPDAVGERKDRVNGEDAPMDTGPDRTPVPKFPKEPQWEDPAMDLDQWRRAFLKSRGIHKPEALRDHIEKQAADRGSEKVTFHMGVDGSHYERTCEEGTADERQARTAAQGDGTGDNTQELTMVTHSEPPGAGTAAVSVREEREDDETIQETDPKQNEMGKGEVGFHFRRDQCLAPRTQRRTPQWS